MDELRRLTALLRAANTALAEAAQLPEPEQSQATARILALLAAAVA